MNGKPPSPYGYCIRCYVYRRPNLRDDALEMEAYMGRNTLDAIYDQMIEQPTITKLFLSFPERWLNIIEQRQLYERLARYCPNLIELTIKTHSVYIVQCTPGRLTLIGDLMEDTDQSDITVHQWAANQGNVLDMRGINSV